MIESAGSGVPVSGLHPVEGNSATGEAVVNVWLVDHQPAFQTALATALEKTTDLILGGYFATPAEALDWRRDGDQPDIILISLSQSVGSIADVLLEFKAVFPSAPAVILADSIQEEAITDCICAGATGCMLRSGSLDKLIESLREVRRGGAPLNPQVARFVLEALRRLSPKSQTHSLTSRELGILQLMAQGMVIKEIADELAVSYHTVDTHLRNIYTKLDVHSRTGAVAKALRDGII